MSARSEPGSSEGEGDDIRPFGAQGDDLNDSSEEEEEDEEEARRIKEGFIVDDDEEDDDEDVEVGEGGDDERKRRKDKKKRKKRKRENASADVLEEDDLDLIAENTGQIRPSTQTQNASRSLKRFRRRHSGSPGGGDESASEGGGDLPDITAMFDQEPAAASRRREYDDEDDMDDFIVDEDEAEGGPEDANRRRKEAKEKRKKGKDDRWAGVSREAQTEILDIFGDGGDYEDVLDMEDESMLRPMDGEVKYADVFDPSEIASRFMTDKDDNIRKADIPERHQLSTSSLSVNPLLLDQSPFPELDSATAWVASRISERTSYMFLDQDSPSGGRDVAPRYDLKEEFYAAVKEALKCLFMDNLEVPLLWHHHRDSFIEHTPSLRGFATFINERELWICYDLGIKYKAIHERRSNLQETYEMMKAVDPTFVDEYFENYVLAVPNGTAETSVESAAEALEWLEARYPSLMTALNKEQDQRPDNRRRKAGGLAAAKVTRDDMKDYIAKFGLSPSEVAIQLVTGSRHQRSTDYPIAPLEEADHLVDPDKNLVDRETVLNTTKSILTGEFGRDPLLREYLRGKFRTYGLVTTQPTDRGKVKIDQYHVYYPFKYLKEKPLQEFDAKPNFPQILAAEQEGLITITFSVPDEVLREFESTLLQCYCSITESSSYAAEWNSLRMDIVNKAVHQHLVPAAAASIREYLREKNEATIVAEAADELQQRVSVGAIRTPEMAPGSLPSVLAVTCGRGYKDAVLAVQLDRNSRVAHQLKLDDITTANNREQLIELLQEHRPDVVVIGGFTLDTHLLRVELKKILRELAGGGGANDLDPFGDLRDTINDPPLEGEIPLVYVHDAVARIYMNSIQAQQEHPSWPNNARYALGLARYAQDPLNEYSALGADIVAVQYNEWQRYVAQEKLLIHLERALVNVVNEVGVDINKAIGHTYVQKMLPFLAGMGPRKVERLLKGIQRADGTLVNRARLLVDSIVGPVIAQNLAAFIYIKMDEGMRSSDLTDGPDTMEPEGPNPLDATRIHPLDYDIAYQLSENLMGVDPEDAMQQNRAIAVLELMTSDEKAMLLASVDVQRFAEDRRLKEGEKKGYTIKTIMEELRSPFKDRRGEFVLPTMSEIFTMLTGETVNTLSKGLIVTARISGAKRERAFGKLDSGLQATIPAEFMSDDGHGFASDHASKGQTLRGVVVNVDMERFEVTLATSPDNLAAGRPLGRQDPDPYFDIEQQQREVIEANRKKRQDLAQTARIIKHPLWQLFNKKQAEEYLANGNRGDAVIRPSSSGTDHLAITWKVDEGIYQHIDVLELEKPSTYALGRLFRVGGASYMDLDEVLVNHVGAVASQVDKLTEHEKYIPESVIDTRLDEAIRSKSGQSAYGFCLDSQKAGWAQLHFLSRALKDGGRVQIWPVRILPGSFKLFDAEVPGMRELCDAFKAQYRARLEDQKHGVVGRTPRAAGNVIASTPLGMGRTPAGVYGGRTPGAYPGVTPNPYSVPVATYGSTPLGGSRTPMRAPMGPMGGGYTPMMHPGVSQAMGGYTPMQPPPPPPPASGDYAPPPGNQGGQPRGFINPDRARMMSNQSGGGYQGY